MATDRQSRRSERIDIIKSMPGGFPEESLVMKQMKVFNSCIEDLEDSMGKSADSNTELSKKIFYLNVIITIATIFGVVISGTALYLRYTEGC